MCIRNATKILHDLLTPGQMFRGVFFEIPGPSSDNTDRNKIRCLEKKEGGNRKRIDTIYDITYDKGG